MNLLPIDKDYLTYEGSLTTPDFNENVVWLVMRDPIMVSRQNIDSMKEMRYGGEDSLKMTNNCKKKVSLGQRGFIGPTNSAARPNCNRWVRVQLGLLQHGDPQGGAVPHCCI